eukprot:GFUD01009284.1.p1 GENE.GFUD01009284.1~~GFUD01009284.1.p1  ORF type:complete len:470 (+),score=105.83 GFUD01009284.1:48-1412(+)
MRLWTLLLTLLCCSLFSAQEAEADSNFTLTVDNQHVFAVVDVPFNVTVTIEQVNWSDKPIEIFWESNGVYVFPKDELGHNIVFTQSGPHSQTLRLEASLFGIFNLRFYKMDRNGKKTFLNIGQEVELVIKRENVQQNKIINIIFTIIIALALAFMGLALDMKVVLATLKKPIGPAIGMFCQFILMAVFSYLLGWLLLETNYERLGLLLLGCCPGGSHSNFWTAMFHGDVNLSCTMTFISTLGAFVFTSLWVYLLGTPLVGKTIPIPYPHIAISLASFTIPLLAGVAFKYKWPKKALTLSKKISRPFFLLCLITLPIIAVVTNIHFFYLCTWRHIVSGACLGFLGYIFGAGLAALFRQGKPQIIAIALETAIQNGGIAFIVLNMTFSSPYSDMGVLPILSFFFCSTGPFMFVIYAVYLVFTKLQGTVQQKTKELELDKAENSQQSISVSTISVID